MLPKQLSYFPKLQTVLSEEYREEIEEMILSTVKKSEFPQLTNIYSCFVDIYFHNSGYPFNAFNIKNSERELQTHITALIGFIYTEIESNPMTLYKYCYYFKIVFNIISSRYGLSFKNIKVSDTRLTNDTKHCMRFYKCLNINSSLLEYYSGWRCEDKSGNTHFVHLATWCDSYGIEFANQVNTLISNYAKKYGSNTFSSCLYALINLLNEFTKHCKTKSALEISLKAENSSYFLENIFNTMLFESMIKNNDSKNFIRTWTRTVKIFYDCFITTGFFEKPLKPILTPDFKEPKLSNNVISVGGNISEREKERWFVDIPLEIKDEKALEVIHQRLNRDLEHIRIVNEKIYEDINYRLKRNNIFRKSALIKPLQKDIHLYNHVAVGSDQLGNTVATFYHHGFGVGIKTTNYLGFAGQGNDLIRELNLPTSLTLNAIASLLVLEHPNITPSWFQEWMLFDLNGNQIGLKQTGNQWIAVSSKNRRGASLAQQEIILTAKSKAIVDTLIEHTQYAREALKRRGSSDWRYVILIANLQGAIRPKYISGLLIESQTYNEAIIVDSYDEKKQLILNRSNAKNLAQSISVRNIRKARGLQIYLETQSIKAVAEALGHKEIRVDLLELYLPKPLMDYFNTRWVRQFQNSIIFEALKSSTYLFDALDFDERALEEFLINHHFGDLPEFLEHKISNISDHQAHIRTPNELVFTLTTPLLQVLLAIKNVVENASNNETFKPVINKWYQSALFILNHFSLSQRGEKIRRPSEEVIHLYELALNSPLDSAKFKENVLCR